MSGAGDSETPSVSTSRKVRPPIGKSGGASSACDHGVDERRVVGREDAEAVADLVVEAAVGEIEFDMPGFLFEPSLLSRRRDRNVASTGLSRERPGAAALALEPLGGVSAAAAAGARRAPA